MIMRKTGRREVRTEGVPTIYLDYLRVEVVVYAKQKIRVSFRKQPQIVFSNNMF